MDKEKLLITSGILPLYIYVFGGLVIFLYAIFCFISSIFFLVISLPILIGFIYYFISKVYKIYIYQNRTEYIDFRGNKHIIDNKNIYYVEHYFISKNHKYFKDRDTIVIKIIFPNKIFSFYKDEYSDYDKLKEICKEKFIRTHNTPIHHQQNLVYYICGAMLLIGVVFSVIQSNKRYETDKYYIEKQGYTKLKVTYKDYKTKISKSGSLMGVELYTKEYPKVVFDVDSDDFKNNRKRYKDSIFIKDKTLTIHISANEYERKIIKSKKNNFYDIYFGKKNNIHIYKIDY